MEHLTRLLWFFRAGGLYTSPARPVMSRARDDRPIGPSDRPEVVRSSAEPTPPSPKSHGHTTRARPASRRTCSLRATCRDGLHGRHGDSSHVSGRERSRRAAAARHLARALRRDGATRRTPADGHRVARSGGPHECVRRLITVGAREGGGMGRGRRLLSVMLQPPSSRRPRSPSSRTKAC